MTMFTSFTYTVVIFTKIHLSHGQVSPQFSNQGSLESPFAVVKGDIVCNNDSSCPTLFYCNSERKCQCGEGHDDMIKCSKDTSAVLDCNCVTYNEVDKSTSMGKCFFNCGNLAESTQGHDFVYHSLPSKPEGLITSSACSRFNRTGLLCGECEKGLSPFVLSYNLSCTTCPSGIRNWWKFVVVGFVPLTVFYFFILFFNINVTSSRLHGVVWFSQIFSIPALVRIILSMSTVQPKILKAIKVFLPFYSVWNLEIFRSVIPDICLPVSTLQALTLEYLVALYPLVLIVFTYFLIELYDQKFTPIVNIWRPFYAVFSIFRRKWDIRTSVIDSFASFFLLSYVKVLSVSADLLLFTHVYKLGPNNTFTYGLYYCPNVIYFGREHFPYAALALTLLAIFVLIPLITLALYPFHFFQKFLSCFKIRLHFLHAFVDSFQGCYKDGTEPGTFDCRWFSVLMLLVGPLFFIFYGLTLSIMFFVYTLIVLAIILITVINIQPFKEATVRYTSTDPSFMALLSLCFIATLGMEVASIENYVYTSGMFIVALSSAFVPIIYITFLIVSWLISKWKSVNRAILCCD